MRPRTLGIGIGTTVGAALATAVLVGPTANAGQIGATHPCSPGVTATGTGTLGTPWVLKAQSDPAGTTGAVIGAEFQINTPAGQQWSIQLADNGLVFFNKIVTSGATGATAVGQTPAQPGTDQVITATADNLGDGEHIDAKVVLPDFPCVGH